MRYLIFLVMVALSANLYSQKGSVIVFGGGKCPESVLAEFAALAGGPDAKVLVVPFASNNPDKTGNDIADVLSNAGFSNIQIANAENGSIDSSSSLDMFDGVSAVYIADGSQASLMRTLSGTEFLKRLKAASDQGSVVMGDGAGACALSKVMLTGEEISVKGSKAGTFSYIKSGCIVTSAGLGILDRIIVDSDFLTMQRQNRLISALLDNPALTAVGVDTSTAIVINPDGKCKVMGENQIMAFSVNSPVTVTETGHQRAHEINSCLLMAGDELNLAR